MKYKCKYCGKEFDGCHQVGGHVVNCVKNPKAKETNKKRSLLATKRKTYKLNCKGCNKEYTVNVTENAYAKGDYNLYCSRGCANARKHTKAVREKISKKLTGRIRGPRAPQPRDGARKRIYNKLMKEIGSSCFFCGYVPKQKQWNLTHRKDGKKHKLFGAMNIKELQEINPKEYVRLCGRCHMAVHWCMKYLNMPWGEIENHIPGHGETGQRTQL